MTTDHERDQPHRRPRLTLTLTHEGVTYSLTRGQVRGTVHVFTDADDHVGAVTQLALPHAVWEWLRDQYTPPSNDTATLLLRRLLSCGAITEEVGQAVFRFQAPGALLSDDEMNLILDLDVLPPPSVEAEIIMYGDGGEALQREIDVVTSGIEWPERAFPPFDRGFEKDGGTLDVGIVMPETYVPMRERIERTIKHIEAQPNQRRMTTALFTRTDVLTMLRNILNDESWK